MDTQQSASQSAEHPGLAAAWDIGCWAMLIITLLTVGALALLGGMH
jgi:hypothetical protein